VRFKAIRADVARRLLPLVADTGWFFDTELLVLAERSGLRIHEVPVDWVDDPDSRVDIVATATADLKGIARMRKGFALGRIPVDEVAADLRTGRASIAPPRSALHQLAVFGAIGVVSTLAYLTLFSALHLVVGSQAANFLALLITAIGNTAANRRFTFGVRGQAGRARHHGEGLLVFAMALLITSGSLASVHALVHPTPHWLELGVLVTANLVATVLRFIALRSWVFHPNR
jgi:putative flippase GtrA